MLFYWIYGDTTIEIYLASVFFGGLRSDSQGIKKVIWNRRVASTESKRLDRFFRHLPIIDKHPFNHLQSFTGHIKYNHCLPMGYRHKQSHLPLNMRSHCKFFIPVVSFWE